MPSSPVDNKNAVLDVNQLTDLTTKKSAPLCLQYPQKRQGGFLTFDKNSSVGEPVGQLHAHGTWPVLLPEVSPGCRYSRYKIFLEETGQRATKNKRIEWFLVDFGPQLARPSL